MCAARCVCRQDDFTGPAHVPAHVPAQTSMSVHVRAVAEHKGDLDVKA